MGKTLVQRKINYTRANHLRFCPSIKEKNKARPSQNQSKNNLVTSKADSKDRLIAKVKTNYKLFQY